MPFNPEDLSLRALARSKFEAIDRGDIALPGFLLACRLKILMVIDGVPGSFLNVSFSDSYFGLATVLDEQGLGEFAGRYQKSLRQTEASMKSFSAVFKNLPKTDVFLAKEKESAKPRKSKAKTSDSAKKKKK